MTPTMKRLAIGLAGVFWFLHPCAAGAREVSLEVLADEEFRSEEGWQDRVRSMIAAVAGEFERRFQIGFRVTRIREWRPPPDLKSLELLAEDLDRTWERGDADMVVAFTARKDFSGVHRGCAMFRPAIVVVKSSAGTEKAIQYLTHEMAHIFGAVHLIDKESIMDLLGRGTQFDDVTSRLIALNRDRRFNTPEMPFPDERLTELIGIYQSVSDSLGMVRVRALAPRLKRMPTHPSEDPSLVRVFDHSPHYNAPEDVSLLLSRIYIDRGRFDEARRECEKALELNQYSLEAKNQLGIIERRTGNVDKALALYREVLTSRPNDARVLYNLGIAYARKGQIEDALAAYRKAVEAQPNLAEAHCNLGEIYLRQNDLEKAEDEFLLALSAAPQFALAHCNLAEVLLKKGDLEKAAAEVDRAIVLRPSLAAPYNVRGNLRCAQGRFEEAISEYRHAISLDEPNERAHFNLGNCYIELHRVGDAIRSYARALEILPEFAEAHAALGNCHLLESRPDQAATEIRKAHELGFRSATSYLNLSTALLQQEKFDEALSTARTAVEMDDKQSMAHCNIGVIHARQGDVKRALDELTQALALDPRNSDAHVNLGALYLQIGDDERALSAYQQAILADPRNGLLHNNLAVLYFRRGQFAEARQCAEKAQSLGFRLHPDFLEQLASKPTSEQK